MKLGRNSGTLFANISHPHYFLFDSSVLNNILSEISHVLMSFLKGGPATNFYSIENVYKVIFLCWLEEREMFAGISAGGGGKDKFRPEGKKVFCILWGGFCTLKWIRLVWEWGSHIPKHNKGDVLNTNHADFANEHFALYIMLRFIEFWITLKQTQNADWHIYPNRQPRLAWSYQMQEVKWY